MLARSVLRLARPRILAATARLGANLSVRAPFSTSSLALSHGKVDADLAHKLGQELDYEISNEEESKWLSDFQKDTPFTLVDASGQKEFKLTRSFGNEKITVLCNIDSVQFPEEFDEPVPEEESQLSLDLVVLIEKSSGTQDLGTMELKVTLDNNDFFIEHVGYSGNSALMAADSAEAEHARDTLYGGPVFEELAESVKDVFHQYLEERGFNAELADFLSRYAQHKEQQEYVSWLKQVKGFIAQ